MKDKIRNIVLLLIILAVSLTFIFRTGILHKISNKEKIQKEYNKFDKIYTIFEKMKKTAKYKTYNKYPPKINKAILGFYKIKVSDYKSTRYIFKDFNIEYLAITPKGVWLADTYLFFDDTTEFSPIYNLVSSPLLENISENINKMVYDILIIGFFNEDNNCKDCTGWIRLSTSKYNDCTKKYELEYKEVASIDNFEKLTEEEFIKALKERHKKDKDE